MDEKELAEYVIKRILDGDVFFAGIRLLLYTLGIWFIFVILAILNGLFRTFFLEPKVGEYAGHVISTIILVCVILVVVYLFFRRIKIDYTKTELLFIGTIWLILSILFEFVFGHYVLGISCNTLLADYNILKGRIWILVPLVEFTSPLLFGLKSQIKNKFNINFKEYQIHEGIERG